MTDLEITAVLAFTLIASCALLHRSLSSALEKELSAVPRRGAAMYFCNTCHKSAEGPDPKGEPEGWQWALVDGPNAGGESSSVPDPEAGGWFVFCGECKPPVGTRWVDGVEEL